MHSTVYQKAKFGIWQLHKNGISRKMVKPTNMEMASSAINGKGELYVPNSYNCERNYKETIEKKLIQTLLTFCVIIFHMYIIIAAIFHHRNKRHTEHKEGF